MEFAGQRDVHTERMKVVFLLNWSIFIYAHIHTTSAILPPSPTTTTRSDGVHAILPPARIGVFSFFLLFARLAARLLPHSPLPSKSATTPRQRELTTLSALQGPIRG